MRSEVGFGFAMHPLRNASPAALSRTTSPYHNLNVASSITKHRIDSLPPLNPAFASQASHFAALGQAQPSCSSIGAAAPSGILRGAGEWEEAMENMVSEGVSVQALEA